MSEHGDQSWQCWECGTMLQTETELDQHMTQHHGKITIECLNCGKCFDTKSESEEHIASEHTNKASSENNITNTDKEKDDYIQELLEKNEMLVRKNVALDKENKRMNMAFNQCLYEKDELKREIRAQNETINDVIKENAKLNDEIKVKAEIIKILQEKDEPVIVGNTNNNAIFSTEK